MPVDDNRLDIRIDPELKEAIREEACLRGQSLTVFTERALKASLGFSEVVAAHRKAQTTVQRGSPSPSLERFATSKTKR